MTWIKVLPFCRIMTQSQLLGQWACHLYTDHQHTTVGHMAQLTDVDTECGTACGAKLTACCHIQLDLLIERFLYAACMSARAQLYATSRSDSTCLSVARMRMPLACQLPAPATGGDCLAVEWYCAQVVIRLCFMAHASICLLLLGVVVGESSWCTPVHFLQPCAVPHELRIGSMSTE